MTKCLCILFEVVYSSVVVFQFAHLRLGMHQCHFIRPSMSTNLTNIDFSTMDRGNLTPIDFSTMDSLIQIDFSTMDRDNSTEIDFSTMDRDFNSNRFQYNGQRQFNSDMSAMDRDNLTQIDFSTMDRDRLLMF